MLSQQTYKFDFSTKKIVPVLTHLSSTTDYNISPIKQLSDSSSSQQNFSNQRTRKKNQGIANKQTSNKNRNRKKIFEYFSNPRNLQPSHPSQNFAKNGSNVTFSPINAQNDQYQRQHIYQKQNLKDYDDIGKDLTAKHPSFPQSNNVLKATSPISYTSTDETYSNLRTDRMVNRQQYSPIKRSISPINKQFHKGLINSNHQQTKIPCSAIPNRVYYGKIQQNNRKIKNLINSMNFTKLNRTEDQNFISWAAKQLINLQKQNNHLQYWSRKNHLHEPNIQFIPEEQLIDQIVSKKYYSTINKRQQNYCFSYNNPQSPINHHYGIEKQYEEEKMFQQRLKQINTEIQRMERINNELLAKLERMKNRNI